MDYASALTALADPTRRAILERVRRTPRTVGELARLTRISQPGVSQHLRVLREAKLVTHDQRGTRRFSRPDPQGLEAVRKYVESFWDDVLAAFAKADPAPPTPRKR